MNDAKRREPPEPMRWVEDKVTLEEYARDLAEGGDGFNASRRRFDRPLVYPSRPVYRPPAGRGRGKG